jgi:hypothetical protein
MDDNAGEHVIALRLMVIAGLVFIVWNLALLKSLELTVSAFSMAFLVLSAFTMGALAMDCATSPPIRKRSAVRR